MADIGPNSPGPIGPGRGVQIRRLFTWRMNLYRLIVGVVVLAIVIPSCVLGVRAEWFVTACVLVVIGGVTTGRRVPFIREWLRR